MICAWIDTSSAVVGSSATISLRLGRQRQGDHHALAHAAGELVRIVVDALGRRRDAGVLQQADGAVTGACCLATRGRWVRMVSTSCRPTVYSGFSEVSGSWKMAPILRPRMLRICVVRQVVDALAPAAGSRRRDAPRWLQQPDDGRAGERLAGADSPTTPSISPGAMSNEMSSSARRVPRRVGKFDDQVFDLEKTHDGGRSAQSGVERIAQPVAQQVDGQGNQHQHHTGENGIHHSPENR
jgi:hypothetical protein